MAKSNINVPAGFGGLVRYGEEYESKLMLKPEHVIIMIAIVIIFVIILKLFWTLPVA
jgi:preprotein translocase subunit Sec61beta